MDTHREVLFGNSAEHYWRGGNPHPVLRREVPQGPPPSARGAPTPLRLQPALARLPQELRRRQTFRTAESRGVVPSPVPGVVPIPPPALPEEGSPSSPAVHEQDWGLLPLNCMCLNRVSRRVTPEGPIGN